MLENRSQHHDHGVQPEFWSAVYSGRAIAILNHYGRLHVYLDHILQHNVVFAEPQDALAWLIQRIKQEPALSVGTSEQTA
jgi:hypothetical protein